VGAIGRVICDFFLPMPKDAAASHDIDTRCSMECKREKGNGYVRHTHSAD
jgi:hypothetical protein